MSERLIYLDRFTDEVMPCLPHLDAWAAWLSKPDPVWSRPEAAEDGATFEAYELIVLGDVRADMVDGKWELTPPAPEGTDTYFMRHSEGSSGWDAEHAGNAVEDALDCLDEGDGPVWLACVKTGENLTVRFHADGPRCSVEPARDPAVEAFLDEVRAELTRARTKFPGDRVMTVALAEEFGELCKAVLDEPAANVRKEAVQTAVMAARIVLDGDGSVTEWRAMRGLDPLVASSPADPPA